jgi:glucose-6-phosphate isomerase
MHQLTDLPEWHALTQHYESTKNSHMRTLFAQNQNRFQQFSIEINDILFDYCRNRVTEHTLDLLIDLANASHLLAKREAMFAGNAINCTEKRAVLHTALRDSTKQPLMVNGQDIKALIRCTKDRIRQLVESVHHGEFKGITGKAITDIVNIGIGGSYLGPMVCEEALKDYAHPGLRCHYLSTVDKVPLLDLLAVINPETTLFIISSKTFTTIETLTNAKTIADWLIAKLGPAAIEKQFVAITAATQKALQFGINQDLIFPMWEWIGGRYSVWSAIGLPLALAIGVEHYQAFLNGAEMIDQHFKTAPLKQNIPVIMALLSIWYHNFYYAQGHAIAPYAHRLRHLIAYLQQADMESNGKAVRLNGEPINYLTSTIIFGQEGCNGQHAYHQLLHQGKQLIPTDVILIAKMAQSANDHQHHDVLISSGLSQAQALMQGKTYQEAKDELIAMNYPLQEAEYLAQHRVIPGNKPCNIFFIKELNPHNLGALIALYEHKIFVQGAIWDINSFDQWGVELGKQLLPNILAAMHNKGDKASLDSATLGLINHYQQIIGTRE